MTADEFETDVEDGFGGAWVRCGLLSCDLHVVRPGKVQCSGFCDDDDVPPLDGSW